MTPVSHLRLYRRSALLCGLGALGLLVGLPALAGADPVGESLPATGSVAWWLVALVVVVQAVAVAWSARRPGSVLPGLAGVTLLPAWFAPSPLVSVGALAVMVGVLLATSARPLAALRVPLLAGAALLALGQFASVAPGGGTDAVSAAVGALLQAVVVVGIPLLVGLVVAARRAAEEARRREVAAVRGEQEARLVAAVSAQRTAMSRELHDIAAHHLSGIAVLAAAMERQVVADPDAAAGSARAIRTQSRVVLDDLRRLVGLLREGADAARPVETLAVVRSLVEARRAAGGDVELVVDPAEGTAIDAGIGPLAQLVAHRMVQEALANATVHAPGSHCVVELDHGDPGRLVIAVRNGAPSGPDQGPGGGFGLVGMAERAQLVGAELAYGPTPDAGWEVRMTLSADADGDSIAATSSPEASE